MPIARESAVTIDFADTRPYFGYDSLEFSVVDNTALEPESVVLIDGTTSPASVDFEVRLAESYEDLERAFDANAQAEGAFLGAKVNGSAKLLIDTQISAASVTLVAFVSVVSGTRTVDASKVRLSAEAAGLEALTFYQKYGDFYLARLIDGGKFVTTLTVTASSLDQKAALAAGLNAAVGHYSTPANFKARLEAAIGSKRVDLQYFQAGGASILPPGRDFATVIQFATEFPDNVKSAPKVFAADFFAYASVRNAPNGLPELLLQPSRNIDGLAGFAAAYGDAITRAEYFIAEKDHFPISEPGLRLLMELAQGAKDDRATVRNAAQPVDPAKIPGPEALLKAGTLEKAPVEYTRAIDEVSSPEQSLIRYGRDFTLRSRSGLYIIAAVREGFSYPQVASTGAVALRFADPADRGGHGPVYNGYIVQIVTTENMSPDDTLGAFVMKHNLYYAKPDYGKKQQWKATRKDGGNVQLRLGDELQFESLEFKDQFIVAESGRLTTKHPKDANENDYTWIIVPASSR